MPFDATPIRQSRLAEAVTILKGCFADGPFSFAGEHYSITDYDAQPTPVQRPHPPILIGGGGRRTLELAAREANVVGLAPRILRGGVPDLPSTSFAATREKIDWVREAARDRFAKLELNIYPSLVPLEITREPMRALRSAAERLSERIGVTVTPEALRDSPHVFVDSVDGFVERFGRLRDELGITSIMVGAVGELDPVVERLAGT